MKRNEKCELRKLQFSHLASLILTGRLSTTAPCGFRNSHFSFPQPSPERRTASQGGSGTLRKPQCPLYPTFITDETSPCRRT
jgi:hypothetical protein